MIFNLTIASEIFPAVFQNNVSNFEYGVTNVIEFDIPSYIELDYYRIDHYAILVMYSYSLLVEVELLSLNDLKSDLENCFSNLHLFIDGHNLVLRVTPTGSCTE